MRIECCVVNECVFNSINCTTASGPTATCVDPTVNVTGDAYCKCSSGTYLEEYKMCGGEKQRNSIHNVFKWTNVCRDRVSLLELV